MLLRAPSWIKGIHFMQNDYCSPTNHPPNEDDLILKMPKIGKTIIRRTQMTNHLVKRGKDSRIKLQMIFDRAVQRIDSGLSTQKVRESFLHLFRQ